ncbi:MAG TPA: hypothetical protein VEB20_13755 [Azospirillaceae bacterium]|nr:hypothetical protein [Azospirillaceae bacterium]
MSSLLLVSHIIGAGAALLAGAAALWFRKGGTPHARAGILFAVTMLVMTSTGAVLAAMKPTRLSLVAGTLTFYLVATAWAAARRRDGRPGRLEAAALPVALLCAVGGAAFGVQAMLEPGGRLDRMPPAPHFVFAALAAFAAALDVRFLLVGSLTRLQRLRRHLWRMCTAMAIATMSFFLGQQKHLPEMVQGSPFLFLPVLAVLGAMVFWLFRLRARRRDGKAAPSVLPLSTELAQEIP